MTDISTNESTAFSYLPHAGSELPGCAPPDAFSPEIAEKNADEVIRRVMADEKHIRSRKMLPELAPEHPSAKQAGTVASSREAIAAVRAAFTAGAKFQSKAARKAKFRRFLSFGRFLRAFVGAGKRKT